MNEFKFIFWMEYAHRMWGRALGVVFAGPFAYFVLRGYISKRLGLRLSALMTMGAAQGFVGWWMVKSGLEVLPSTFIHSLRWIRACDEMLKYVRRSLRPSIFNQE